MICLVCREVPRTVSEKVSIRELAFKSSVKLLRVGRTPSVVKIETRWPVVFDIG